MSVRKFCKITLIPVLKPEQLIMLAKKISFFCFFLFFALFQGFSQENANSERQMKAPRGYRSEALMKVAYAIGFIDLIETKPEVPENIEVMRDIVYKQVDTILLQLDIYKRKDLKKDAPLLIFIHGGSWTKGKRSDYLPYLIDYAEKGYITATVSYRLSQVAPFPAAVEDVKCAVSWLRSHAEEYMIIPEKIAVIGGSAGAHLAMMLAYSDENEFSEECTENISSKVQAVVNLYGPVDLTTEYARNAGAVKKFLGTTYQENPEIFVSSSPKTYISSEDPPTLTFNGTLDSLVPVSQADSLNVWLNKAGVYHDYHRLKGWPHTMDISEKVNEYCQYYMDIFFKKYLITN